MSPGFPDQGQEIGKTADDVPVGVAHRVVQVEVEHPGVGPIVAVTTGKHHAAIPEDP